MTVKINTGYQRAFRWLKHNDISFVGYLNRKSGLTPDSSMLKEMFGGFNDAESFRKAVAAVNGVFSTIINRKDVVYAACCPIRYFPLFYAYTTSGDFFLSDDIEWVATQSGSTKIDAAAQTEFMSGGFTCSKRTLFEGIYQIRPGEYLVYDGREVSSAYYFHFSKTADELNCAPYEDLKEAGVKVIDQVFDRLLGNLQGQKVALALSGGYDSRLIAVKLKEAGFRDVVCFTYGRPSHEVEISQRVAQQLGYAWHFVEYTHELVESYEQSETFTGYYPYAARGCAMFYLQEYPAIKHLLEKGIIDTDHVTIPGHSGGLIRGTFLIKYYPEHVDAAEIPDLLFKQKFFHHGISFADMLTLKKNLWDHIQELNYKDGLLSYSLLEDWEIKERTSKYIFNSSHAFTYFDICTFFPLADRDLLHFFRSLPFQARSFGQLYKDILENTYFRRAGLDFYDDIQPRKSAVKLDKLKRRVRPYLPSRMKKKLLIRNDWPFYGPMTQPLLNELKQAGVGLKENGASYLSRILRWYIYKTEERLKN